MSQELYVPGHFRCPKCRFHLVSNNLNIGSATISAKKAGDREVCVNCPDTFMEPFTWKAYALELEKEMGERVERHINGKIGVFVRACEAYRKRHPDGHNTSGYGCGCELCKAVEVVTGKNPMADDEVLAHHENSIRNTQKFIKDLDANR